MLSQFFVGSMDLPDLPSHGISNFEPVCRWRCELTRPTLTFSHSIYPHLVLVILSPFVVAGIDLPDLPSFGIGLIRSTLIGIVNFYPVCRWRCEHTRPKYLQGWRYGPTRPTLPWYW